MWLTVQGSSIFGCCIVEFVIVALVSAENVAVDHIGHCYFLEDSAEKDTWFEGNLGMGTKIGYLTEGDLEPSTFWITTPVTTLINNVAAGSNRY